MVREDYYPLLVKYVISTTVGNSENANYSDWNIIYALKENPTGYVERLSYGITFDYDKLIIVDASEKTRKIKSNSIFLINEFPTSNFENGNYYVTKLFPEYQGKIMIALKSANNYSLPRIYYFDSAKNEIFAYQLNFDLKTLKGYVGKYEDLPFTSKSKIWYREPTDENDTEFMLSFVSQSNVGIVQNLKLFKELTFVKI
mgnify:CR=1 FL=1